MTLRLRLVAIIGLSLALLWSVVAVWMFMDVREQLRTWSHAFQLTACRSTDRPCCPLM